MNTWLRLQPNMRTGSYDTYLARGDIPEPVWPDLSFQELIRLAFSDGLLIDGKNHYVFKRLVGLD